MTNEEFFEQFGHLANAPGGIARLRRLILELAVRGRLVPQDPNDEPASALVDRITKQREQLAAVGRLKGSKVSSASAEVVVSEAVSGWSVVRLGDAVTVQNGSAFESAAFNDAGQGMPLLRIRDIVRGVTETWYDGPFDEDFIVEPGDLVIGMDGNFNHAFWKGPPALLNQRVCRLVFWSDALNSRFVNYVLGGFLDEIHQATSSVTVKHLSSKTIANIRLPLPPVVEQQRIVERVKEMMALCDELDEGQARAKELRAATARSSLSALVESDRNDAEQALSIIKNHLRLSIRPGDGAAEVVTEFRKAILDLAVRGRLVPTDPASEVAPVDHWNSRRDEWTSPTARDKRNRTSTTGYPLGSGDLPDHWRYARFEEVAQLINGRAYKKGEWRDEGTPVIRIQNLNGGDSFYFSDLELPDHNYCEQDDLLFAWSASFGPYIWEGPRSIFHYHIWKVLTSPAVERSFMFLLLSAMTEAVRSASHGLAMLHMTKGAMEGLVVPVPPIDEQHRIVRRVGEMMALCDELEQQLHEERELATDLSESAVSSLLAQVV